MRVRESERVCVRVCVIKRARKSDREKEPQRETERVQYHDGSHWLARVALVPPQDITVARSSNQAV